MLKPLSIVVLSVALAALAGCGGVRPVAFKSEATGVPLAQRNYKMYKHGLRGEACNTYVLGFGIGDESYSDAIAKIHEQVDAQGREYQLVNVVEDSTFNFYLFAWKSCTVITTDVVILEQPAYFPSCAASPKIEPPAEPKGPPLPKTLTKEQINLAMQMVSLKINECIRQYFPNARKGATMPSQINIARTGLVIDAQITGPLKSTPGAVCIEAVIKTAKFPQFEEAVLHVEYPIIYQ